MRVLNLLAGLICLSMATLEHSLPDLPWSADTCHSPTVRTYFASKMYDESPLIECRRYKAV